jgi:tetratricopeptide (TPR) repeat protein
MREEPENPAGGDDERDPIEALAAEFTARRRRGDTVTIEQFAAQHPALADDIRDLFPMIVTLEDAKEMHSASATRGVVGDVDVKQLGDFQIVREIGRGGMGIVYEAEQESLGRRVALKVLPREVLKDAKQVERFEREARTAARLHHTNIVPIFGVGHQDGYHYYVMQYIRGVGLDAVSQGLVATSSGASASATDTGSTRATKLDLFAVGRALAADPSQVQHGGRVRSRSSPTVTAAADAADASSGRGGLSGDAVTPTAPPRTDGRVSATGHWRDVARIGLQVAEALTYAHAQGTLHRDIKPGNLLLDGDGVVWVADFGLAKAVDQTGITQPGDVVGTLRYMAPEQFRGQADTRCDIYSLGVTLYELATLQPAFASTSRGTLVDAIMQGRLAPPRLNGQRLPRDLETILLKATACAAEDRYATAADLAEDLRRFLADQPVRARRVTVLERGWRWARRNPTVAGLTGSVAVLLVAITVLATAGYFHQRRARQDVWKALQQAVDHRQRAERVSGLALDALDTIFDEFAPEPVTTVLSTGTDGETAIAVPVPPAISRETAALLEHMLGFYERLAEADVGTATLGPKIAEASLRVGEIHRRLGENDAARAAYGRAAALYGALAEAAPDAVAYQVALARIDNALGLMLNAEEEYEAGRARFAAAYARLKAHASDDASPRLRLELAHTCILLAEGPLATATVIRPGMGPHPGGHPREPRPPGTDGPPRRRGLPGRADAEWHQPPGPALGPPADAPPPEPLAEMPGPPAGPAGLRGQDAARIAEQEALLDEAAGILGGLIAADPDVPEYQRMLARCYMRWPPPAEGPDALRDTEAPHERAVALLEALVAAYPEVPEYRFDLSEALLVAARPGDGPRRAARLRDTQARLDRARALLEALVAERPNVPAYTLALVRVQHGRGHTAMRAGRREDAAAAFADALRVQLMLVQRFPQSTAYVAGAALLQTALGDCLLMSGQPREAEPHLRAAVETVADLLATEATPPPYLRDIAHRARHLLSGALAEQGRHDEAASVRENVPHFPPPTLPPRPPETGPEAR